MYRIGQFSQLGRVTIKTLHHYDEVGLLQPAFVDADTGYRYYTTEQLFRLNRIVAARQMGFSIADIAQLMDGAGSARLLQARLAELEDEAQSVTDRLTRLKSYISEIEEGKQMSYQAVIKEIPAYTVFSARYTLANYAALNEVMPALGAKVAAANPGIKCVEPDYCFNIYLDGEYRDKDINVEICQAVTSRGIDGDGIVFKEMPAVTVASVLHRGSYAGLAAAYAYVVKWAEQNGYRITDSLRESYIDGVWNKDSVDDWLTEIQAPVEKA